MIKDGAIIPPSAHPRSASVRPRSPYPCPRRDRRGACAAWLDAPGRRRVRVRPTRPHQGGRAVRARGRGGVPPPLTVCVDVGVQRVQRRAHARPRLRVPRTATSARTDCLPSLQGEGLHRLRGGPTSVGRRSGRPPPASGHTDQLPLVRGGLVRDRYGPDPDRSARACDLTC
jgi:hypothetical protein